MKEALPEEKIIEYLAELNFDDDVLWRYEEHSLTKVFTFKDFQSAVGFMAMVALYCEKMNHHPDWQNRYNQVFVSLTTHDVSGVTKKDFKLAEHMDDIASKLED